MKKPVDCNRKTLNSSANAMRIEDWKKPRAREIFGEKIQMMGIEHFRFTRFASEIQQISKKIGKISPTRRPNGTYGHGIVGGQ